MQPDDYEYPYVDLRVDVHDEPVVELRQLYERLLPVFPYCAERGTDRRLPRLRDRVAQQAITGATP